MASDTNRRWLLTNRPAGEPSESDFEIVEGPIPQPGEGQFVARALYLSLDPYMRGRMRDVKSYAPPAALGEVMIGGVVSQLSLQTTRPSPRTISSRVISAGKNMLSPMPPTCTGSMAPWRQSRQRLVSLGCRA